MKTIVFIHGMFQNPRSWQPWQQFFTARGYECVAPAWPFHDGEPSALRADVPAGLGELSLRSVVDHMRTVAAAHDDPILIGHSVGGLVVQLLAAEGIGSVCVPICSVAPNRMLALDWGFFRNSAEISNPLKGDDPIPMDEDGFHRNFANTMDRSASDAAFRELAVPDSRNVFRECLTDAAKIDVDRPHIPFLFIGAEKDEIIPAPLCERNAKAYTDPDSRSDYTQFADRGHFICGEPGWQEVATSIANWLEEVAPSQVARMQELKPL